MGMTRRDFVCAAAGAAAARGAQPAKTRIAFLGVKHSHAWEKVRVVRESPQYELAGVWAEDEPAARRYREAGVPLLDQRALLEDGSIQVVAVESEVKDHARHARMAVEAGKHIHLEKPPAANLGDFRSLLALAAKKKALVQVGYMWRSHPGINTAMEAARKGWLGEIYLVRGTINTQVPAEDRAGLARFPGGLLFELGCHLIDPLVRLMGRPQKVTPALKRHGRFQDGLADNTAAVFEYPRALGIVSCSALHPGAGRHRAFEVFGTNGTAVVRPIEPPKLEIDLASTAGPYKAGVQTVPMPAYRRYVGEFDELATAVRNGAALRIKAEEDLMVQEALLRACGM
jgi:predicted dehydrogenase